MSRVSKAVRQELLEKMKLQQQVQNAVDAFNNTVAKSLGKLKEEVMEYQELLIKLEK